MLHGGFGLNKGSSGLSKGGSGLSRAAPASLRAAPASVSVALASVRAAPASIRAAPVSIRAAPASVTQLQGRKSSKLVLAWLDDSLSMVQLSFSCELRDLHSGHFPQFELLKWHREYSRQVFY